MKTILVRLSNILLIIALTAATASQAEARTWAVAVAHAQADDAGPGTEERPFRTIAPAALAAQPGDTILVHPGVYRQRVVPARGGEKDKPIVYLSAQRGQAVIKGSDVFAPKWERVEGPEPIFRGVLDPVVFQGENPFHRAINAYQDDIKLRDVAEEFRRRLKQAGTAEQQLPEPDAWAKNPRLTLDYWRLLLERDRGSQQHRMTVHCDDRALPARLTLTLDSAIAKMPCTLIEDLSADFRGQSLPASGPLPGPFQGLQSGENKIVLEPGADKSP